MIVMANLINFSLALVFVLEGLSDSITKNFPGFVLLIFVLDTWLYLLYYSKKKNKKKNLAHSKNSLF